MNTNKRHNRAAQGTPPRNRLYAGVFTALLAIGAIAPVHAQRSDTPQEYSIQAGSVDDALKQLARQNKLQIAYSPDLVKGKTVSGLSGRHTWRAALQQLLRGTGLEWGMVNDSMVVIKKASTKPTERAKPKPRAEPAAQEEEVTNMPAIMVTGTKTLNMDITRTEDDPQPYVVFDREQIERSGATSLEQFLQQRLTMNTSSTNFGAGATGIGIANSQITLRGLSAAQTLILVDGHRVSGPAFSGTGQQGALNQADITGLPLGAIERIEVLPTTASGIYGGSATGGVINIILRRDYTGAEVKFTYDNTFDTDTSGSKLDLTLGHTFNEGRTNLMVTANYSEANNLLLGDRDFAQRGREVIWRHNQSFFVGPTGQPPLGGTPNIASADGSNLVLKNGTNLEAAFTSVPKGYAGPGSDGGAALVENAGSYNWALAKTSQQDESAGGSRQALYTRPRITSGGVVVRHEVSDRLQAYTELSSSSTTNQFPASTTASSYRIQASSPVNPFAQDILVTVPLHSGDSEYRTDIKHNRALAGLIKKISHNWMLGFDYTWDRTTITNTFPNTSPTLQGAVSNGDVDILRDTNVYPVDISPYAGAGHYTSPFQSTMTDASLRASGPVGMLPGGAPELSASVSYRDETVENAFRFLPSSTVQYYPERSQTVSSAYLELRLPLFSAKNARNGLNELELQLAIRRDQYTSRSGEQLTLDGDVPSPLPEVARSRNRFASADPTIALRWKPWEFLALRTSYGTGFLPPPLNQLVPTISPTPIVFGADPRRGNTQAGPFTYTTGGNADLKPEQSKSWSAGVVLTPEAIPNLRFSVDYTRIEKVNNIAAYPGGILALIRDEALFPGRILRGPNLPGDPAGWAGPIMHIDFSQLNLATAWLEAWDVQLDVRKETKLLGNFDFSFTATWQPHYRTQVLQNQPEVENASVNYQNPLKFKANASVIWARSAWRAGWNINHFGGYQVYATDPYVTNQGRRGRVPSQTYNDVFIGYDFGLSTHSVPAWLVGTDVQLGIRNVFGQEPPLDALNSIGFYSRFGDPRLSMYYLTINRAF